MAPIITCNKMLPIAYCPGHKTSLAITKPSLAGNANHLEKTVQKYKTYRYRHYIKNLLTQ